MTLYSLFLAILLAARASEAAQNSPSPLPTVAQDSPTPLPESDAGAARRTRAMPPRSTFYRRRARRGTFDAEPRTPRTPHTPALTIQSDVSDDESIRRRRPALDAKPRHRARRRCQRGRSRQPRTRTRRRARRARRRTPRRRRLIRVLAGRRRTPLTELCRAVEDRHGVQRGYRSRRPTTVRQRHRAAAAAAGAGHRAQTGPRRRRRRLLGRRRRLLIRRARRRRLPKRRAIIGGGADVVSLRPNLYGTENN